MLTTLILIAFALGAPYGLASFVEWQINPALWSWYMRLALAVIYGFYVALLLIVLSDIRKGGRKL